MSAGPADGGLTARGRIAVLLGCAALALLTAWYAGSQQAPGTPSAPTGSVRLGPEPGEPVAGYLARLPGQLPAPGAEAAALVQLTAEIGTGQAAGLAGSAPGAPRPTVAVFRVPLPRVQTALRFEPLDPGVPVAAALDTARERARLGAEADADRLSGRAGGVAAAEAAALADPACPCTVALVVRGDRAALETTAARPGVRAVDAAPAGVTERELALAPLLPGQLERADPLPDDGPVPPA